MSRSWLTNKAIDGWVMWCDVCFKPKCAPRPRQDDLVLIEFADAGWMIGAKVDACPDCVRSGKTISNPKSREALLDNLPSTTAHCEKYYGRKPQSPSVERYATALTGVVPGD